MMSYGAPAAPRGVRNLLIANLAVYVLLILPGVGPWISAWGSLSAALVFAGGQVWRLASYMFLHDTSVWHILFNMYMLWIAGAEVETLWGTRRFVIFYFLCGVGSGLFSVFMWQYHVIGASGAVFGVLTAYALAFPRRTILFFFVFPMPAWVFVLVMGVLSLAFSLSGAGGVAHIVHLGGILVAFAYLKVRNPVLALVEERRGRRHERGIRVRAEGNLAREQYFEQVIDPILKKISEQGMDSLSSQERKALREASKRSPDQMRRTRVVPLGGRRPR